MKKSNKKAMLTLAVLSALSPIFGGVSEAEYGHDPGLEKVLYNPDNGTFGYSVCVGSTNSHFCDIFKWIPLGKKDGDDELAKKVTEAEGNAKSYTDEVAKEKANISLDNINEHGEQVIRNTVAGDINTAKDTAINVAAGDATNKASAAESNAKSYTDIVTDAAKTYAKTYTDEVAKEKANIGLDNINDHGEQVIRDIAKDAMKNSGIDTTGDTIIIDKPMKTKDIYVDGKIDTTGDAHIGGNITVDGDSHIKGNSEVDGDSHIHGSESIDKNLNVKGKTTTGELEVTGKSTFDGDTETKGNATFDKDVTVKGNTDTGTLTVEGDSHMKGNVQIDKNLTVEGDSEVDGDSHIHGSESIDKDLTVHGNETVDGNSHVKGTQAVDGDATFGKNVYVAGETNTETLISRGDAAIGGNLTTVGNAEFKSDVHIAGNQTVDGDIYGKSFNVGNERYIDKDGINANDHKVRNVADGEVSETSKDAVNGSQLYRTTQELSSRLGGNIDDMNRRLTGNISEVAAQSAAMAGLHPLEWDKNDKVTISTSVGSYKSNSAMAIGAFYRPDKQSMISLQGAVGSDNNMYSLGYSQKLGKVSEVEDLSDEQLKDKLAEIGDENKVIKTKNADLQSELDIVKNDNAGLKEDVSILKKAYQALMEKLAGK